MQVTAEEYIRLVDTALRDLPWSQRKDLVAELQAHVAELPPETDLFMRLGPPTRYANEMREAAGLERQRGLVAYLRARRRRNLIIVTVLAVLLLTAIGLAIGAVIWVDSYQPLQCACSEALPDGSRLARGQAGYIVDFGEGKPFEYGAWIVNDGGYTVRVLGAPTYHYTDFFVGHLFMSKNPEHSMEPLERFHPFDLPPGASQWLVFKGVFACTTGMGGPGVGPKNSGYGGIDYGSFPVRYRFYWRTATAQVPLTEPLEISFRKQGCPSGGDVRPKR